MNILLQTVLPASARDVYYRDEIGNISTSNLREQDDSVELELRPRFPLFGGWKTHYYIGYNVPSYQYLYENGELASDSCKKSCNFNEAVQDMMNLQQVNVQIESFNFGLFIKIFVRAMVMKVQPNLP